MSPPAPAATSGSGASSQHYSQQQHSGRERAIEMLIDMESQGDLYRAARVMEEAVPRALMARPNLVTRGALVEQAHSLHTYEISTVTKYDQLFPPTVAATPGSLPEKDRVLRHFRKILSLQRNGPSPRGPPPALIAVLNRLVDDGEDPDEESMWKSFVESVSAHTVWQDDSALEGDASLECMIYNLCNDQSDDPSVLIMAALAVLMGSILPEGSTTNQNHGQDDDDEPEKHKSASNIHSVADGKEEEDHDVVRRLQVASLLSLLVPDVEVTRGPFVLDSSILAYLREAAQVYEERIEIQTQRLLQKERAKKNQQTGTDGDSIPIAPLTPAAPVAVVEEVEDGDSGNAENQEAVEGEENNDDEDDDEDDPDMMARDEGDEHDAEEAAAALSAAVFDRIISAVTGGDADEDDEEDGESLGVDRAALQLAAGLTVTARGDSSEEEDSDDSSNEPAGDQDDDDDDGDDSSDDEQIDDPMAMAAESDDDDMLRQALALSLADHGFSREDGDNSGTEGRGPNDGDGDSDVALAEPGTATHGADHRVSSEDEDDLPAMPKPPSHYPYANILIDTSDIDADNKDSGVVNETNPFVDPSALKNFGFVPSSYAMVHLFRTALTVILRQRRADDTAKEKHDFRVFPGGMGCSLFVAQPRATEAKAAPDASRKIHAMATKGQKGQTLRVIVSAFLVMIEHRNLAIEGLKQTVEEQQQHAQENENHGDEPLSEEEDDPALVLAGANSATASADPSSSTLSRQSLEEKGMHRKARAAAHEAAVRMKALRKKVDGWKDKAKLFSFCAYLALRCLRGYLQCGVSDWLQRHYGDSLAVSTADYKMFVPAEVARRFVDALDHLGSVTAYRGFATLMSDDDNEMVEDVLMPLRLYREAVTAWGECSPFLLASKNSRYETLVSLVDQCDRSQHEITSDFPLKSIVVFPSSEVEVKLHRLNSLCRRLCVTDVLDEFVPQPVFFNGETEKGEFPGRAALGKAEAISPSSLVDLLGTRSALLHQCEHLGKFYNALCHRLNLKVLLWDGLYAVAADEQEDASSPNQSSPSQESIRVIPNTSNSLVFDSLKCSDSIAIIPNEAHSSAGSAAHQRASKVWGTVLSSAFYSPKTGVHRWAVRLDKCERGHVFVGVSTSQASMRTYVGGDKYGWGFIGTMALWHDRRKIRGDYGATFRTGSTIIVTLDTDAGTLSFSSWKDTAPSNSFSLDPLLPTLSSPRRQQHGTGTLEDWGVAFEGLPLDAKLYPAVGLYQRDDKITLLQVESGSRLSNRDSLGEVNGGSCYYPAVPLVGPDSDTLVARVESVQHSNSQVSIEAIKYVRGSLESLLRVMNDGNEAEENILAGIASISSSISLYPSTIPVLSQRFALAVLPHVTSAIKLLCERSGRAQLFSAGLKTGKWVIRATGSGTGGGPLGEYEEYVVDFTHYRAKWGTKSWLRGSGVGTTGKSKNGLVTISGSVNGSAIHFVEEWKDTAAEDSNTLNDESASACFVAARLSIDGSKFEGTYKNVQYGTTGHISGILVSPESLIREEGDALLQCQALLCLAHGHLVNLISEDHAGDHKRQASLLSKSATSKDQRWWALPIASVGAEDSDGELWRGALKELKSFYDSDSHDLTLLRDVGLCDTQNVETMSTTALLQKVEAVDERLSVVSGATGSLGALCPEVFANARLTCVASLLKHAGLTERLDDPGFESDLCVVWSSSLRLVEDGLRSAVAESSGSSKREAARKFCNLSVKCSEALLGLESSERLNGSIDETIKNVTQFHSWFVASGDFEIIEKELQLARRRGLLRFIATTELNDLLKSLTESVSETETIALECAAASLPRLLGRAFVAASRRSVDSAESGQEISGHFLDGLAGCGRAALDSVTSSTHLMLQSLGRVMLQVLSQDQGLGPNRDSLLLALLAVFTITVRDSDFVAVIKGSHMLKGLRLILAEKRSSLASDISDAEKAVTDKEHLANQVTYIARRDVSRAVLRSAVSAAHLVTFQVSRSLRPSSTFVDSTRLCLELMTSELREAVSYVEMELGAALQSYECDETEKDYEVWLDHAVEGLKDGKRRRLNKKSSSAVVQLLESGTLMSPTVGMPKPTKQPKSSGSSGTTESRKRDFSRAEDVLRLLRPHLHHHLSHWMHILSSTLKSPVSLELLVADDSNSRLLYDAVGLYRSDSDSRTLLPCRYRGRLLRLIAPLATASDPEEEVIRGLLKLAGSSHPLFNRQLECDDPFVSREATTLLRMLHSPEHKKWRSMIDRVVLEMASKSLMIDPTTMGVLHFIGGPVQSLQRGSMVLLKPPEAAAVSAEAQISLSSKSHSGSSPGLGSSMSGAVHNVVGNGIGSIVSGLCRSSASAGLVSSIDTKTGICEIILMERDPEHAEKSGVSRTLGSRGPALTVRALRTPMTDVAMAQEFPLFLDEDFPAKAIMEHWFPEATKVLSVRCEAEGDSFQEAENATSLRARAVISDGARGLFAVLVVRTAAVILSDERILTTFLSQDGARRTLANLLSLAASVHSLRTSEGQVELETLSSLPIHESRQALIFAMLKEVETRARLLEATSGETWVRRKEDLSVRLRSKESTADTPSSAASSGGSNLVSGPDRPARTATGTSSRHVSRSSASSNSTEDEDESEAAATAAAHLREAAIAQMAELGLPRSWSELALRRTGGTNIEAAVHFCLERGGDMERLIAEERERERIARGGSRRRGPRNDTPSSSHLLRQLLEMGFPRRWCEEALAASRNNVDEALTWILTNGERLSAEDEGMEEEEEANGVDQDDDDSVDDDDDDEASDDRRSEASGNMADQIAENETDEAGEVSSAQESSQTQVRTEAKAQEGTEKASKEDVINGWKGSVTPIRFISGRSIINPKTLAISGLPTGGFSSVGTKGVLLTSGKWYYEAILETAGCLQIGWADGSFSGHCHADRGDGCGDGPSSWAYDGWRRYRWHATATEWGCRWKEGDVVGCLVDMDEKIVAFTLNGRGDEIGMGTAFSGSGFRPCGGIYACVSFNRREKLRLILGGEGTEDFKHRPPPGYRGVGEAVFEAVKERSDLLLKESVLEETVKDSTAMSPRRFLCDFSDGEHGHELYAWQHRYYGNDASVHLGSGRGAKSSGSGSKLGSGGSGHDLSAPSVVSSFLLQEWSKSNVKDVNDQNETEKLSEVAIKAMDGSYRSLVSVLGSQLSAVSSTLGFLYARKLVLQIVVSLRESFDLVHFTWQDTDPEGDAEAKAALNFWSVLDSSVSLRSLGWGGEAGAMAIAAEALGLGISSAERSPIDRTRAPSSALAGTELTLPVAVVGLSQMLSTIVVGRAWTASKSVETGLGMAACAEAAIGADGGGGPLVFLQKGLQIAAIRSPRFAEVLVAVIRRSVRLLAVVDYAGDDSQAVDPDEEELGGSSPNSEEGGTNGETKEEEDNRLLQPDARLTCFLSGLLLSEPVRTQLSNTPWVMDSLFEAWSIGLMSASAPWRMVCGLTAAGILTMSPKSLSVAVSNFPTLARFFSRLPSTVARRVWAERAALPVCSRYVQAMTELLASVKHAFVLAPPICNSISSWDTVTVDAASPLPKDPTGLYKTTVGRVNWEWDEDWLLNDNGWDFWSGTLECQPLHWTAPNRSAVRTLMDGGEGPPMLREGCFVLRGSDWEQEGSGATDKNEDGKDRYENEKAEREREKKAHEEQAAAAESEDPAISPVPFEDEEGGGEGDEGHTSGEERDRPTTPTHTSKKKKRKKFSNPKLPVGTVLSVDSWNGIPALGRRVRWNLTGVEGVYRYGGDGGRFDLVHVEVNERCTRVKKRHPLPESAEQCASRHGFGSRQKYAVSLKVKRTSRRTADGGEEVREGIMELPDFAAGILVNCNFHNRGSVTVEEVGLLYGAKDSGWDARFGQPSFRAGTKTTLSLTVLSTADNQADNDARSSFLSMFEEMKGCSECGVRGLRNRSNGHIVRVRTEITLLRERQCSQVDSVLSGYTPASNPPPIRFDKSFHAPSLSISRDGRTITCVAQDGRGSAFATTGFSKGAHYWEVKLEQADIGSVFIGVAEKPAGSGSGSSFGQETPRLNRWLGWGFVNFRATYTAGAERVYGAHCHNDDTVGVLLDCDAGRLSFFYDGLKYGEHILNDLGCAFENLSPFGFNAAGCGSGGAGQGAPSGSDGGRVGRYPAHGAVRPRTLWPVIGLRNLGDRVTFSSKFLTSGGIDGTTRIRNVLALDEVFSCYDLTQNKQNDRTARIAGFPEWFVKEAFDEYQRWRSGRWVRTVTRGSGPLELASSCLDVCLDCSPVACATACAGLGLKNVLLAGDRVAVKRSAGRQLELAEEAMILGAYQGRLFYRLVSQKSEGGSLTEGGGRAWFWDESEVVDDSLQLVGTSRAPRPALPLIDRFRCLSSGGLRIVYQGGAVVRSDLEIFDRSENMGSIPCDTVIPQTDVLERRVSSCGIVRYRVRYEPVGVGWISSRIRGGMEEPIIEPLEEKNDGKIDHGERLSTPLEAALVWYGQNKDFVEKEKPGNRWEIATLQEFTDLIENSVPRNMSASAFDTLVSSMVGSITDNTEGGDSVECSFRATEESIQFAVSSAANKKLESPLLSTPAANQAVAAVVARANAQLPSTNSLLARIALLRALNRRCRYSLPWLCVRPSQEGSAILGGLCGHGAPVRRTGLSGLDESKELWVEVPSVAKRLRKNRGVIFSSVKRLLLDSIIGATMSPTPLSHDEYELPREIRTVRVNRLKARRAMAGRDNRMKRKHSVFSQLLNETRSWGGAALRRGFVAKGHGGQKRAFKVKLVGEGVNDYSGPYREVFTDAFDEVMEHDEDGSGDLGVLDATPNSSSQIGDNRELYMFSVGDGKGTSQSGRVGQDAGPYSDDEARIQRSFAVFTMRRDESTREVEESLVFLGRLVGTACRHGIPVDLPLPMNSVWRAIVEQRTDDLVALREMDLLASHHETEKTTNTLLLWQQRMLKSFMEGMSHVIPVEVLALLTGEELRDILCGNPDVDVDLLKRVVEYEGYAGNEPAVQFFWDALREMSLAQRKKFLQFVWARSRLPKRESDFEAPFKIVKDAGAKNDAALPAASTCFFSLTLPEYSSKEILKEKLLFAIEHVCTMESDYVTNDAEVGEGWRGL